jgi:hypothetical protein
MGPEERAILDWLQLQVDDTFRVVQRMRQHMREPWAQRKFRLTLGRRVNEFMERATLFAAEAHRCDAFHREFFELAELAWSLPQASDLDPIDWDGELAGLTGGAA